VNVLVLQDVLQQSVMTHIFILIYIFIGMTLHSVVFSQRQRPIYRFLVQQGRHVAPIKVVQFAGVRSSLPNFTLIGSRMCVHCQLKFKHYEFYQHNCP